MARTLGGLIAGLLFGVGLSVSGMMNPAKVVGFLDIAGAWDPSLAFVMLGALAVAAIGFRTVLRRGQPLFEPGFALPTRREIDPPLLLGAGLFGAGWGLGGYCPGPALAGLGFGSPETFAFVATMLIGMLAARQSGRFAGGLKYKTGARLEFAPSLLSEVTDMHIQSFFDPATSTVTYVVADPLTKSCAVIDPVLDFDAPSGRTSHASADGVMAYVKDQGLRLEWVLETHAHADHLSAGSYIKSVLGGRLAIGAHIVDVQKIFTKVFNLKDGVASDGSQFDMLFKDGDTFGIGGLTGRVIHTPGHTPACVTYVIGDAAFVGDTLFMPDYGSARADFPGGDARTLYRSMRRILALPEDTRIFTCHDYKAPGRTHFAWESSVGEQRRGNIHARDGIGEEEFVAMRTARDKTLGMPHLILPSIQVNIRAGALPPPEDNGVSYLKLPVNAL